MEKVYLDEGLWYIENFLKENELSLLKKYCDDPNHWYTTMRSPYKNILNKWPMSKPRYDEDGTLAIPNQDDPVIEEVFDIFNGPEGIFERLRSVLPEGYAPNNGIQTFKYCTDEEIKRDRDESMSLGNAEMFAVRSNPDNAEDIDYAMDWHWEDTGATGSRIASHSIYLNDDFEGGYIEFKKGYIVKPKAGMLINIPIGKEFTHRVTKVLGPNSRHTLYGQCWSDNNIVLSTKDDC